jgi:hypothetical protein
VSIATAPATTADVLDQAATVITLNGYHQAFLYDTTQAKGGTSLARCRVDLVGAINIALYGTPRFVGSGLGCAAEQALAKQTFPQALVVWNDTKGRTGDDAIRLLRDTAAALRGATA